MIERVYEHETLNAVLRLSGELKFTRSGLGENDEAGSLKCLKGGTSTRYSPVQAYLRRYSSFLISKLWKSIGNLKNSVLLLPWINFLINIRQMRPLGQRAFFWARKATPALTQNNSASIIGHADIFLLVIHNQ